MRATHGMLWNGDILKRKAQQMAKKERSKIKPLVIPKASFESGQVPRVAPTEDTIPKDLPISDISEVSRLQADHYNQATRGKHMANEVRFSFYNHNNILHAMGYHYSQESLVWDKTEENPRAIEFAGAAVFTGAAGRCERSGFCQRASGRTGDS